MSDETKTPETTEPTPEIRTIPVTRRLEKIYVTKALTRVQALMDEAKRINDEIAAQVAADDGYIMKDGDQARFGMDDEGEITLNILVA